MLLSSLRLSHAGSRFPTSNRAKAKRNNLSQSHNSAETGDCMYHVRHVESVNRLNIISKSSWNEYLKKG